MSSDTKKQKDPLSALISIKPKNPSAETTAIRPKNPAANLIPSEGYLLEIDGKFKATFDTEEFATKAGLDLKRKFPQIQVKVFDAKQRKHTIINLLDK